MTEGTPLRVIVTGPTDWIDAGRVWSVLDLYPPRYRRPLVVIEGDAEGVDRAAGQWAERNRGGACHGHFSVPAGWTLGKVAGVSRNEYMLAFYSPELVIAFHDNLRGGTADMVERGRRGGLAAHVWGTTGDRPVVLKPWELGA